MGRKLYKIKLNDGHKAFPDQVTKDGYLTLDGVNPTEHTIGVARVQARAFNGKAEFVREEKYLYIKIDERNGEYEYTYKLVRAVDINDNPEEVADEIAANFYYDLEKYDDGGYIGTIGYPIIRVVSVNRIDYLDFEVLTRYL
jgi:hypothetical protein